MDSLVKYEVMSMNRTEWGEAYPKSMYEYIFARNGIFLYSSNEVFTAVIPISIIRDEKQYVRGLEMVDPSIRFQNQTRVPAGILRRMVSISRLALPNEILFYLTFENYEWKLQTPAQKVSRTSAKPLEDGPYIPIEIHSHNTMLAFFSETDNRDETGMRIYGVLGRVDQPVVHMRLRISIYGHYSVLPYEFVFEPTAEVKNG